MNTHGGESGISIFLTVIGFVFGLISLIISFIPILGSLAFFIAIPAALISMAGVIIARAKHARFGFPIASLTVCLIAIFISAVQYFSIVTLGKAAQQKLEQMSRSAEQGKDDSLISEDSNNNYSIQVIDPKKK